jgi:hypothetical protein
LSGADVGFMVCDSFTNLMRKNPNHIGKKFDEFGGLAILF